MQINAWISHLRSERCTLADVGTCLVCPICRWSCSSPWEPKPSVWHRTTWCRWHGGPYRAMWVWSSVACWHPPCCVRCLAGQLTCCSSRFITAWQTWEESANLAVKWKELLFYLGIFYWFYFLCLCCHRNPWLSVTACLPWRISNKCNKDRVENILKSAHLGLISSMAQNSSCAAVSVFLLL